MVKVIVKRNVKERGLGIQIVRRKWRPGAEHIVTCPWNAWTQERTRGKLRTEELA